MEKLYKQLRVLPYMPNVNTIWKETAREKRPDGLATICTETTMLEDVVLQIEKIPLRFLDNEDWFERQWEDDNDLFTNSFGQWIEKHGCIPMPGYYKPSYEIDLNKLKAAIMELGLTN